MNKEIKQGRWKQITGKSKRAWGRLVGNEDLAARGEAEIVAGALEESMGIAKERAVSTVTRGVDRFAATTKKIARSL